MNTSRVLTTRKPWVRSIQGWSWVVTVAWIAVANFWHPFGLYGLVCMLTPIFIALSGRGKMHCARICPRGSFIGFFTKKISLGLKKPGFMKTRRFHWTLWGVMMGTFAALLVWAVPQGLGTLGNTILIFMETATGLAFLFGILFTPRAWCTVCPMGFTTGNIRGLLNKKNIEAIDNSSK
jgi:hypothetical protein